MRRQPIAGTTTFTVVDIRKVVDKFAADFSMMALATGLRTRESVANTVSDLKILAESRYLVDVKLILKDSVGTQIRAAVYSVSEAATGWKSDRPGNNLWPKTPDGCLKVVATLTKEWWTMPETQKSTFITAKGMHSSWTQTDEDTSFSSLAASTGQTYESNGYGWQRTNYSI